MRVLSRMVEPFILLRKCEFVEYKSSNPKWYLKPVTISIAICHLWTGFESLFQLCGVFTLLLSDGALCAVIRH